MDPFDPFAPVPKGLGGTPGTGLGARGAEPSLGVPPSSLPPSGSRPTEAAPSHWVQFGGCGGGGTAAAFGAAPPTPPTGTRPNYVSTVPFDPWGTPAVPTPPLSGPPSSAPWGGMANVPPSPLPAPVLPTPVLPNAPSFPTTAWLAPGETGVLASAPPPLPLNPSSPAVIPVPSVLPAAQPTVPLAKPRPGPTNPKAKEQRQAQVFKAFAAVDTDHNGTIDAAELYEVLHHLNPSTTKEQAAAFMDEIDEDRSGLITFEEFSKAVNEKNLDVVQLQKAGEAHQRYEWEIDYTELHTESKLGEGAFGIVWKASFRGIKVAVKELKHLGDDEAVLEDFRKELAMLSKLRHPNIVLLLGACTKPPKLCMVTEFMSGGTLFDVLHKKKVRLDRATFVKIAREVAVGMNFLHLNKPRIIHRDMKSLNILLDDHMTAKVADFGLSRVTDSSAHLTMQVGSPVWMAPELFVATNEPYTEKVDVYAYGIVLWEMLTNEVPYMGMQPMQIGMAVCNQHLRPPIPMNCPPSLSALMQSCWAADPSKRPAFKEILTLLERI